MAAGRVSDLTAEAVQDDLASVNERRAGVKVVHHAREELERDVVSWLDTIEHLPAGVQE